MKLSRQSLIDWFIFLFPLSLLWSSFQINIGPLVFYPAELIIYLWFLGSLFDQSTRNNGFGELRKTPLILKAGVALIAVAGTVGALISPLFPTSLGAFKVWIISPLMLAWLFVAYRSLIQERKIVFSLSLYAALLSVYGLIFYFVNDLPRLTGPFETANYYSMIVGPILLLLGVAAAKGWVSWKFALPTLLLLLAGLVLSKSLGAIIGTVVALGVVGLSQKEWRLGILLVVAVLALIATPTLLKRISVPGNSFESRIQIWKASGLIIADSPIFGVGLRGFDAAYEKNILKVTSNPIERTVAYPHNLILALWTSLGLLGLIGFALVVGWALAHFRVEPFSVALIVILGHGLVDTPYFKTDFVYLFWVYISFIYLSRTKNV